jgi:hypothetical protein
VFYSIYHVGDNFYKAKLDTSMKEIQPPELLELRKQDRNWCSDCIENALVRELGAAIDQRTTRN